MTVYEALQLIIKQLEDNTSCGRLDEQIRQARIILNNYVILKLEEDKEKE